MQLRGESFYKLHFWDRHVTKHQLHRLIFLWGSTKWGFEIRAGLVAKVTVRSLRPCNIGATYPDDPTVKPRQDLGWGCDGSWQMVGPDSSTVLRHNAGPETPVSYHVASASKCLKSVGGAGEKRSSALPQNLRVTRIGNNTIIDVIITQRIKNFSVYLRIKLFFSPFLCFSSLLFSFFFWPSCYEKSVPIISHWSQLKVRLSFNYSLAFCLTQVDLNTNTGEAQGVLSAEFPRKVLLSNGQIPTEAENQWSERRSCRQRCLWRLYPQNPNWHPLCFKHPLKSSHYLENGVYSF